ncbi:MAG: response regulator [Chloroflexia bacterium]|nr:response regulator [Chloroflexia bacterium]
MARILVVDDSSLVRDIVRMRLEALGYQVSLAETGEEAIAQIEAEPPDLLVLDIHLPGKDGYEVCRELRQHEDPAIRDLAIIALTSMDDTSRGFEAGVDDYLNKDFDLLELGERIDFALQMKGL